MTRWPRHRGKLLCLSLVGNLGLLMMFKYLAFGLTNLQSLLTWLGSDTTVPIISLTLPVGISFYTFQSMSYTIDVYRGKLTPTRNVLHFFSYLAMFPQLVAGPIVRARDLLPQLEQCPSVTEDQRWTGLRLIAWGYFKKVVIADHLGPAVNFAFAPSNSEWASGYWWVIMLMFAFQIYCDFSGYSDIARGLARWMGYEFPVNFNHPYGATSFREFWSRWHISLSTWFRDYVYVPLGGGRKGAFRGHCNLWVTMLVSGLWHGAAWTFLVWGAWHALALSVERLTRWPERLARTWVGRAFAAVVVFVVAIIGWVPFRARSFAQAGDILHAMFAGPGMAPLAVIREVGVEPIGYLLLIILAEIIGRYKVRVSLPARYPGMGWVQPVSVALILAACVFLRGPSYAFIYFQF